MVFTVKSSFKNREILILFHLLCKNATNLQRSFFKCCLQICFRCFVSLHGYSCHVCQFKTTQNSFLQRHLHFKHSKENSAHRKILNGGSFEQNPRKKKLKNGDFHKAPANNVQRKIEGERGDSDGSQSPQGDFVSASFDSDHSSGLKVSEISRKKEVEAKEERVEEEETNVRETNTKVCLGANIMKLIYFVIDMFIQKSPIFASKARA